MFLGWVLIFQNEVLYSIDKININEEKFKTSEIVFIVKKKKKKKKMKFSGKVFLETFINEIPEEDIVYKVQKETKDKLDKLKI